MTGGGKRNPVNAEESRVNCATQRRCLIGTPSPPKRRSVNATVPSRLSHAELDNSTELDDGDPAEFGVQLATLHAAHGQIGVLGGCCGTDIRHIAAIAAAHRNG